MKTLAFDVAAELPRAAVVEVVRAASALPGVLKAVAVVPDADDELGRMFLAYVDEAAGDAEGVSASLRAIPGIASVALSPRQRLC